MVYAIIDAVSDVEELITVAYGETGADLARWYVDELNDTADMYLSNDEDFEIVEKACENICVLCEEDADTNINDVDGLTVEAGDISVSVIGAYYNYEEMKQALLEFLSEKPKFKNMTIPDNPYEELKIIDKLNSELIRRGI